MIDLTLASKVTPMAKLSQVLKKIKSYKLHPIYSEFAVELLLLLILVFVVGANLFLPTSSAKAQPSNRSLFFVYLKSRSNLNEKLVETYESINLQLTQEKPLNLPKQILAASTKDKTPPPSTSSGPLTTLSGQALLKPNPSTSDGIAVKRDIEVYKVRAGDTVGRIASGYGVSVETILGENGLGASGFIRPGQELKILPVSGVRHVVKEGETIGSIAKKYGIAEENIEDIFEYNDIEVEDYIFPGEEIIIPGGVKKTPLSPRRREYLSGLQREDYKRIEVPADYHGPDQFSLIWPLPQAHKVSQYFWRRHRGIDVPCRDCQILAAAGGIVELSGWQKGYGYTIVLNHGGETKTRYAHGRELLVSAGDSVTQGQSIMISGDSGRSTGPHLHFEVIKFGTWVNPLPLAGR